VNLKNATTAEFAGSVKADGATRRKSGRELRSVFPIYVALAGKTTELGTFSDSAEQKGILARQGLLRISFSQIQKWLGMRDQEVDGAPRLRHLHAD